MTQPLLEDLEGFDVSVLCQARRPEPVEGRRHEDPCDSDVVTRGAFPCVFALGSDLDGSGHVSNRYLVRWLLHFYILETHELRAPDAHDELPFDLVSPAFVSRALQQRVELVLPNHLVNLEATNIAHVDCHLHLGLDIR